MPSPASCDQPSSRQPDPRPFVVRRNLEPFAVRSFLPAVERERARERIDLPWLTHGLVDVGLVMPPIVEHVRQAVANLARRLENPRVVAICEHRAATALATTRADRSVELLCTRDSEYPHPGPQRLPVLGLDEQMDVIALDA